MFQVTNRELVSDIAEATLKRHGVQVIRPFTSSDKENELVFFFKPEIFLPGAASQKLIDYSFSILAQYEIDISSVVVYSGEELDRMAIMDAHYGYINSMSRKASKELSENDANRIRELVDASRNVPILGGHEILGRFPKETASSLDKLWASKRSVKIRSGLYAQFFEIDSVPVVIINGFHPEQLAYFTSPDRSIVVLVLHTNLPWRFLRTRILGDTFPEKALPGTIRRHYYDHAADLGLPSVSIANNCVHMSAGPFEAAFELENFLGHSIECGYSVDKSNIGQRLVHSNLDVSIAISNPSAIVNQSALSLFDATEEIDSIGAIELFRKLYARKG